MQNHMQKSIKIFPNTASYLYPLKSLYLGLQKKYDWVDKGGGLSTIQINQDDV